MQKRRGRDHIDCGRPWRLIDIALIMHDNTGPEPPKAGRVGSTAQMTLMPHLHVCQPTASPSLHTHTRTPFAAHQYGVRRSVRLLNEDWARAEQVKIIRDANECEIAFYDSLYALLPLPLRRCTSSTSDPQRVGRHSSWLPVAAATAAQNPRNSGGRWSIRTTASSLSLCRKKVWEHGDVWPVPAPGERLQRSPWVSGSSHDWGRDRVPALGRKLCQIWTRGQCQASHVSYMQLKY